MKKRKIMQWCYTVVLSVFAVIWIMPMIAGVLTSFKTTKEMQHFVADRNLIPQQWTLENYEYVFHFNAAPVLKTVGNTLIACVASIVLVLILCSLSAYGFERFRFRYKETLFWSLFTLSAIPNVVALVPQYNIYKWLGWLDHLPSIIAPTIADVFYIFLMRQFIHGIPRELDESARADGASYLQIFTRIIVPLLKPILILVGVFKFSAVWNDFMWPMIAITTPARATITPTLRLLSDTAGAIYNRSLAGCVIAIVPTLIVFLLFRKQFLKGLDMSAAVKG